MFWIALLRTVALLVLITGGAIGVGEASYPHAIQMYDEWSCTSPGTATVVPPWQGMLHGASLSAMAWGSAGALAATIFAALAEILAGSGVSGRLRARQDAAPSASARSRKMGTWWRRLLVGWLWLDAALLVMFGTLVTIGLLRYQHPFLVLRGVECTSPESEPWLALLSERQIFVLAWSTGSALAAIVFVALAQAVSAAGMLRHRIAASTGPTAER